MCKISFTNSFLFSKAINYSVTLVVTRAHSSSESEPAHHDFLCIVCSRLHRSSSSNALSSSFLLSFRRYSLFDVKAVSICHCLTRINAHSFSAQRQATKDAGAIVGLRVLPIINEPPAAIAYGFMVLKKRRPNARWSFIIPSLTWLFSIDTAYLESLLRLEAPGPISEVKVASCPQLYNLQPRQSVAI